MLFEDFLVDAGAMVKPFQECRGRKFHQILEPDRIHGKERQVVAGFFDPTRTRFVEPGTGGDVGFQPQNRIDVGSTTFIVKFEGTIKISVIGDGE